MQALAKSGAGMPFQFNPDLRYSAPSFVADATTPTASAGDMNDLKVLPLKSPLARGDTASMMGCPDADISNDASDTSCHAEATSKPDTTQSHLPDTTTEIEDATHNHTAPSWLPALLTAQLFEPCPYHPGIRKNESNFFCLGCTPAGGRGMCKHCLPTHCCPTTTAAHRPKIFQVRRYMYQNVVHVDDIHSLFDVSGVQAYCINGKRAVLIAPKPPAPGLNGPPVFANRCRGCAIPLRPDCGWCSLSCKVDGDCGGVPRTPHDHVELGASVRKAFGSSPSSKAHHHQYYSEQGAGLRSSLLSSRGCPSDASTITRVGVKRRKLDFPLRAPVF